MDWKIRYPKGRVAILLIAAFAFGSLFQEISSLTWLGVHQERGIDWNGTRVCRRIRKDYSLTEQQARICRRYTDTMPQVHHAASLAVTTCQQLFKFRRWNCSSLKTLPRLTSELTTGTKEQALVYALSSAALTYTIAKGCAASSIRKCGCSQHPEEPPNGNFKWGGCGDNVKWAIQFSRQFMDSDGRNKKAAYLRMKRAQRHHNKKRPNLRRLRHQRRQTEREESSNEIARASDQRQNELMEAINFHNSRIGRKLLLNTMTVQCKCHGVSGSCSVKTCWKSLPLDFSSIGEKLMQSYKSAIEVHQMTSPSSISIRYDEMPSLLYVSESPDYCEPNPNTGISGTKGRICHAEAYDDTSCDNLCCGRGYKTRKEHYRERCECKYVACCYVECKMCNATRTVHTCD